MPESKTKVKSGHSTIPSENSSMVSPPATPVMLTNDSHMLSVINLGTGGDDQAHVQQPSSRTPVVIGS